jgi:hypothetical protein
MTRRLGSILLVLATAAGLTVSIAGPASAGTKTFNFTGEEDIFVVPAGVTSIQYTVVGAPGGGDDGGGRGAIVTGSLPVTPNDPLFVVVGGQGDFETAGFNGGGDGGPTANGGGGASELRTCIQVEPLSTAWCRLVVAGGGGGDSFDANGGDAGAEGLGVPGASGGGAGTSTSGGTFGSGPEGNGEAGRYGAGGDGSTSGGGGGGGGYFGGGGGGSAAAGDAAGGGGSSLVPPGGTLSVANTLTPRITISWSGTATGLHGPTGVGVCFDGEEPTLALGLLEFGVVPGTTLSAVSSNTTVLPNSFIQITQPSNPLVRTLAVGPVSSGTSIVTVKAVKGSSTRNLSVRVLVGTAANNNLAGTSGIDMIFGLAGNDSISGSGGNDLVCGGDGDDPSLLGGAGRDGVNGEDGNDVVRGDAGYDLLLGGDDRDVLLGDAGNDFILADVFGDDPDDDRMFGSTGDDFLLGQEGADWFYSGSGYDTGPDFNPDEGDVTDGTLELGSN